MKTLKVSILSFLLLGGMLTNSVCAQKGPYAKINLGYNFGLGSEDIGINSTTNSNFGNSSTTVSEESVTGSFGKGASFGLAFGYMVSENIGFELGVSKLIGATYELNDNYSYVSPTNPNNFETSNTATKISARMLQINPSVVVSAGKTEGLNPYGKFGLVIGTGAINLKEEITSNNDIIGSSTSIWEVKMNGGIALGVSAALGANYYISEKMSLFGELNMINMSYAPSKGELTKHTEDGIDQLPTSTTQNKEADFVDKIDYNTAVPEDESKPEQVLKTNYSFGSLGLNIGVRYSF